MVVPEAALPLQARGWPKCCHLCADRFECRYGLPVAIMHADLIPGMVGFRIFQAMPKRVRLRAAFAGCLGKGTAHMHKGPALRMWREIAKSDTCQHLG